VIVVPNRDSTAVHLRRLTRSRGRARRVTVVAAALTGAAAVALPYGGIGLPDLAWAAAAAGAVASSVVRWRDDRVLRALPAPAPAAVAAPALGDAGRSALLVIGQVVTRYGARGSSAAPLLRRLDRAARAMSLVAASLGPSADDARREAVHAERALRAAAARLVAVERAAAVAPPDARVRLDPGAAALRTGLAEGVTAYERLVAAAGECVAADAVDDGLVMRRLAAATDALHGLAAGLAEVTRVSARWGTPA
jgi:hypothetical protein